MHSVILVDARLRRRSISYVPVTDQLVAEFDRQMFASLRCTYSFVVILPTFWQGHRLESNHDPIVDPELKSSYHWRTLLSFAAISLRLFSPRDVSATQVPYSV